MPFRLFGVLFFSRRNPFGTKYTGLSLTSSQCVHLDPYAFEGNIMLFLLHTVTILWMILVFLDRASNRKPETSHVTEEEGLYLIGFEVDFFVSFSVSDRASSLQLPHFGSLHVMEQKNPQKTLEENRNQGATTEKKTDLEKK